MISKNLNTIKRYFPFLFGLIFIFSCSEENSESYLCDDGYFYYSGGSKRFFKYSPHEVWIEFARNEITVEEAKSYLEKFSMITEVSQFDGTSKAVKVIIKPEYKCLDLKNFLEQLNEDLEITSATPFFYTSDKKLDSYFILLSEVVTKNAPNITEADFIKYAESNNLELINSTKYSTQHFKIIKNITGFEALDIANKIYESGKATYSHPNFIAKTVSFD